ncbi:MAG: exodeoxyribonuclease VII small subunit [Bryobacterales bacterium]
MASKKEQAAEPETPPPFEQSLDELETIVKELESGDMPLERALELFEKGVGLSESCRKRLEDAETKVEILLKKGRTLEAEPFALDDEE